MNKRHLSSGSMTIILLSLMYSFGTFGFLNLLGARTIVQIALIALIAFLAVFFIAMNVKLKVKHVSLVLVFSSLYAIGTLIHGNQITGFLDVYILIFCLVCLFYAPPQNIIFFAKALVVVTTLLCILVAIAFIYYSIYPDEFTSANFHIYDSTAGHKNIYPGNFMDWVSFTSGDGYLFNGHSIQRLKGYSNEPSSTVVHYVAPAIIAFILGGRFLYLGIFILVVNVVAIASFTTYIILFLSVAFLMLKILPKRLSSFLLTMTVLFFILLILQPNLMFPLFNYFSAEAINFAGFDLLSRKIGDSSVNSTLGVRQQGILDGMRLALFSPMGYSADKPGAGSGLFYIISSKTGWVGIFIFGFFIARLIKNIKIIFYMTSSLILTYGVSLLLAILLISLFVSGYGWSRPPGMIMFLLFFRVLQIITVEKEALPKNMLNRLFGNPPKKSSNLISR